MKNIGILLLLFGALLITLVLWPGGSLAAEEKELVKIGLIYPLSGPMSSFGEDMAKALPLLEEKFNTAQTKYRFKLVIEDGKFGLTNAAITAAQKLIHVEKIKFLVVGSSGEVLQIAPLVEAARVLAVTGFSSHPDVKNAGDYIFRTYIDIDRGIAVVAEDLAKKGLSRIAVISEESSFTGAVLNSLKKRIPDKIVCDESFILGDADLKTIIAKAKNRTPQAYYLNATAPASFVSLFKQLKESGVDSPFYTYYVPSLPEVQKTLGPALAGTNYLDFPEIGEASPDFRSFLAEFERITGRSPGAPFNFRTNYNAVKVVYDAIMHAGPDATKARDFLYSYDQPSATGRLRFDKNGDAVDLNLTLKVFGRDLLAH